MPPTQPVVQVVEFAGVLLDGVQNNISISHVEVAVQILRYRSQVHLFYPPNLQTGFCTGVLKLFVIENHGSIQEGAEEV